MLDVQWRVQWSKTDDYVSEHIQSCLISNCPMSVF